MAFNPVLTNVLPPRNLYQADHFHRFFARPIPFLPSQSLVSSIGASPSINGQFNGLPFPSSLSLCNIGLLPPHSNTNRAPTSFQRNIVGTHQSSRKKKSHTKAKKLERTILDSVDGNDGGIVNCCISDVSSLKKFPKYVPDMKVVSSTMAPGGGKIVSCKDQKGNLYMRVEYDREQIMRCALSPYSLLPPAALKNITLIMPEILGSFPFRHGIEENSDNIFI